MNKKNIFAVLLFTYNLCFSQDLISEGTNKWIFHTPDDGRTTMYVAPYTNNVWQWGVATQFLSNGNVLFTGNVGIGTIAPNAKVEIYNTAQAGHLLLAANDNPNADKTRIDIDFRVADRGHTVGRIASTYNTSENGGSGGLRFFTRNAGNLVENARLNNLGNLGLGTINPISKLSVSGSITLASGLSNTSSRPSITSNTLINGEIRGYNETNSLMDDGFIRFSAGGGTNGIVKSYIELSGYSTIPDMDRNIVMGTSGNEQLRIDRNGNLGIGTKSPDSKLTVNGTIHSTEVKVTQTVPADYVFQKYYLGKSELKPDYTLPTLSEVEKFTQVNHHLPNVPSAKEIKDNGLLLGEMSNILLQKIEELTLYVIEIKKENQEMVNKQQQLENTIKELKNKLK